MKFSSGWHHFIYLVVYERNKRPTTLQRGYLPYACVVINRQWFPVFLTLVPNIVHFPLTLAAWQRMNINKCRP